MNLGKLLGAGKSFFGGKGAVAYRENKRVYLPKFNAEKNPFVPKSAEPMPAIAPLAAKKSSSPERAFVLAGASKVSTLPAPRPARTASARSTSWATKLNPFRAPVPVAPPLVNAVQVELSLDAVKVVHNDLADAEIEVVPFKSHTVATAEAPVLPPARQSWDFLGERLIKAG